VYVSSHVHEASMDPRLCAAAVLHIVLSDKIYII
jgi:hypothetical protein